MISPPPKTVGITSPLIFSVGHFLFLIAADLSPLLFFGIVAVFFGSTWVIYFFRAIDRIGYVLSPAVALSPLPPNVWYLFPSFILSASLLPWLASQNTSAALLTNTNHDLTI